MSLARTPNPPRPVRGLWGGSCPPQLRSQAAALTWVLVFLELALSASSVSEATFSRCRLVLFRGDEASSFTFCKGKPQRVSTCSTEEGLQEGLHQAAGRMALLGKEASHSPHPC